MAKKKHENMERLSILQFFLKLYKSQLGASKQDTAQFVQLEKNSLYTREDLYELKVKRDGKWNSRRMAISRLGENSGSKSRCYKIIYDDILVLKIPPYPISSFDEYIESIKSERRIVRNLTPTIECIAPTVSSILKKIPPFFDESDSDPERFEEKCIRWLKTYSHFQDHLKIGNSFVFFMNLSKYSFLSHIIEALHDNRDKYEEEMLNQIDVLWDLMRFEDQFGSDNAAVFFSINDVYTKYEDQVSYLQKQYGDYSSSSYKTRELFLSQLAGRSIETAGAGMTSGFAEDVDSVYNSIEKEYRQEIESYRNLIRKLVHKRTFQQNKQQLGGIISNILKLLAKLKDKGVAIRDLKPDNVFIVGDASNSLQFLNHPERYAIGLIDFETAVVYQTEPGDDIEQPLLAGTPFYATPSHLFENDLLNQIFIDLPRILHLQDWQAVIGIIYSVATGEVLVEKTGRFLLEIIKTGKEAVVKNLPLTDVFKQGSRVFWQRAVREFNDKTSMNRIKLKSVEVIIPREAKGILREEVVKGKESIEKNLKKQIDAQNIFKSQKSRHELFKAPHTAIHRCKNNWETGCNVPNAPDSVKKQIIKFLKDIEQLKLQLEQRLWTIRLLEQDRPKMSAYTLLKIMFDVVLKTMYQEDWGDIAASNGVAAPKTQEQVDTQSPISVSTEEADAYEKTIIV